LDEDKQDAQKAKVPDEYRYLFSRVHEELAAIVADREISAELATMSTGNLTGLFIDARFASVDESLPKRAVEWVERQRALADAAARKRETVDTVLLLIVLGAFGSMIFLIRSYIRGEGNLTFAAYAFRPVLGMLLALALFLMGILLQTVISTAEATEMRREPLLMLALAAGLLSEQAYELVQARAERIIASYRDRDSNQGDN
jgi:hypothetical protein